MLTSLSGRQQGDHVCWAYDNDATFFEMLGTYVADGVSSGERVLVYLPENVLESARSHLQAKISSLSELTDHRAVILGSAEAAYMPDGSFDPDRSISTYAALIDAAIADGYSGLRTIGEATAIVTREPSLEVWGGYELRADMLAAQSPFLALCAFDVRRCSPKAMRLVASLHPGLLGYGSPSYHLHATSCGGIRLAGDVDFVSAPEVERSVTSAAKDAQSPALDLSGLEFIDAAGMRAVVAAIRKLGKKHPHVDIRGATHTFSRLWDLLDCRSELDTQVSMS